jgi:hypothetical protein
MLAADVGSRCRDEAGKCIDQNACLGQVHLLRGVRAISKPTAHRCGSHEVYRKSGHHLCGWYLGDIANGDIFIVEKWIDCGCLVSFLVV